MVVERHAAILACRGYNQSVLSSYLASAGVATQAQSACALELQQLIRDMPATILASDAIHAEEALRLASELRLPLLVFTFVSWEAFQLAHQVRLALAGGKLLAGGVLVGPCPPTVLEDAITDLIQRAQAEVHPFQRFVFRDPRLSHVLKETLAGLDLSTAELLLRGISALEVAAARYRGEFRVALLHTSLIYRRAGIEFPSGKERFRQWFDQQFLSLATQPEELPVAASSQDQLDVQDASRRLRRTG